MKKVLKNCRIFDGEKFLEGFNDIVLLDGKIVEISADIFTDDAVDCNGRTAVPGYVDIHTHGIAGFDNSDIDEGKFAEMVMAYARRGTTCFIPTFPTIASERALKTLDVYKNHRDEIQSVHLEGPFINEMKKGAQNPEYILDANCSEYIRFTGNHGDLIGRVTLSPEKDSGFELTKYLVSKGIVVSFGHTTCNYEIASEFFKVTDSVATHMFNAMPAIHHREPGITAAALMNAGTACEIIPDLMHLHPEIIRLIFRLKGAEKTICISDSIIAAGLDEGDYVFSGLDIVVENGCARLKSGNLAGSTVSMADGVKNLVAIGIKPEHALMSATSTPAKIMGIEDRAGYILPGRKADLLLLNDDFSIDAVFKNGIRII